MLAMDISGNKNINDLYIHCTSFPNRIRYVILNIWYSNLLELSMLKHSKV